MATFSIPDNGELFIDQVVERCRGLINSGIWAQITEDRVDRWLENFVTPTERYFGACILDALIYRSGSQTVALMQQLFQREIPEHLKRVSQFKAAPVDWLEELSRPEYLPAPSVLLVPVIKITDPPTKSGPLLARLYRRHLRLNQVWMIWPWEIESRRRKGYNNFLFVDDFLATGDQFKEFANQFALDKVLEGAFALYAPLVACEKGIERLKETTPNISVVTAEKVQEKYNIFSAESNWFKDGKNTPAVAKEFYRELLHRLKLPLAPETLDGYGNLALAYAFEHAVPDNSLPLLWLRTSNWEPLFER